MGKEDKWEREREYIIVWKRERNLSREEKEEEGEKKKERTPERRKEPWRALPETHVRWKTLLGRRSREGSFFSFFYVCLSLLLSIPLKYRKRQGPEYIQLFQRNTIRKGGDSHITFTSFFGFFLLLVCVCVHVHTHILYVHVPLFFRSVSTI